MWSRKDLKKKARILIKSNYWRSVSVCFLIAMLTASYPISRSLFLNYFPDKIQTKTAYFTCFYFCRKLQQCISRFYS